MFWPDLKGNALLLLTVTPDVERASTIQCCERLGEFLKYSTYEAV